MSESVDAPAELVPLFAIHGVGRHVPGNIEQTLRQTIADHLDVPVAVSEFNWDQLADHRTVTSPSDALRSLQRICADFHATAMVAIGVRQDGVDARLARLQRAAAIALRHLIACTLAALSAIPAVVIVVLLPQALMQIGQPFQVDELRWAAGGLLTAAAVVAAALSACTIVIGVARAVVQRSFAPLRSTTTCLVLTLITPVLAVISTPLSVSWAIVGGLVGFVSLFGIVASVIEWLLPDVRAYSAWRDFVIAPYLVAVTGGLLALQTLRHLFARFWYEGPIRVLLDITRYVGDPVYRWRLLSRLDEFIRQRQGTSSTLIVVAHSLGTIIALDYLCNFATRPGGEVWLVTAGSPFRRFFLRWLPSVLFEPSTAGTVAVISGRWRSFRWLNVYRPFDYIGTSLSLAAAGVGVDRSTREYSRLDGHGNYWGDGVVLRTILAALPLLPIVPWHSGAESSRGRRFIPVSRDTGPTTRAPHFLFLTVTLALFAVGWQVYSFVEHRSKVEAMRTRIDTQGIRRQIRVAHREIPDVSDEFANAHEFVFMGDGLTIPPLQLSPILPFSNAQQEVDYRKLRDYVRGDCLLEHEAKWYEEEKMLACTGRRAVEIAYLPTGGAPQFYLPGFRSQFYVRDIAGWTLYPLLLLTFISIPALPFMILTSALYAVFLGRDADDAIAEISN
jgi:hypothetical protein